MRPWIIHTIILILILSVSGGNILLAQQQALPNASLDSINRQTERQVSQYGFQSLFSQQQFNASFPFNHRIHPEAWGFIQDYLQKHKKNLTQMKSWALPYFNLIENIMSQYNLPKELKYLAVIESGLSTHAISWAGARGP